MVMEYHPVVDTQDSEEPQRRGSLAVPTSDTQAMRACHQELHSALENLTMQGYSLRELTIALLLEAQSGMHVLWLRNEMSQEERQQICTALGENMLEASSPLYSHLRRPN
jgi:hypothetical protein